ncbi:hypothetical protein HNQ74_001187 [Bartonella doshiae]|uniref:Uncharacterized protein n=2 Tax=Bartonella doshiae TaxID=33044 RepID=A0A380ZEN0_BARDO|nr:hypothetical protein MCS_00236 [Bartonella doshiae NCTC 12862 = ATCC 700133]MBB6159751.1 hypothetical protein [Bartonella doshiae]SUV44762.1 Uncharacterised protein [Bartonella doshiae]
MVQKERVRALHVGCAAMGSIVAILHNMAGLIESVRGFLNFVCTL